MPKLTGAEEKILSILSRGKTNKEIARALGVSPATVKRHLENILKKLQLETVSRRPFTPSATPAARAALILLALWRFGRGI